MSGEPDPQDRQAQEFLRAVISPAQPAGGHRELGTTPLAQQLGLTDEQLGGHWCGRCEGIWYGCMLEVQCPRCGNRHG